MRSCLRNQYLLKLENYLRTLTAAAHPGGFMVFDAHRARSREAVTVVSGVAAGALIHDADAFGGDNPGVILARKAEVNQAAQSDGVVYLGTPAPLSKRARNVLRGRRGAPCGGKTRGSFPGLFTVRGRGPRHFCRFGGSYEFLPRLVNTNHQNARQKRRGWKF